MSALLNCPFCGCSATLREGLNDAAVECDNINCSAEIDADTLEEAVAAWNRRAPPEQSAPAPCPACLGEAEGCGVCNERGTAWGSATVLVRVGDATYKFATPPEQSAAGHPVAVDGGTQAPQRSETERSTNNPAALNRSGEP